MVKCLPSARRERASEWLPWWSGRTGQEHCEGAWPVKRYCLCEVAQLRWRRSYLAWCDNERPDCPTRKQAHVYIKIPREVMTWSMQKRAITWPKGGPRMMLGRPERGGQRNRVHCSATQSHIDPSSLIYTHACIHHPCTYVHSADTCLPSTLQNKPGLKTGRKSWNRLLLNDDYWA